MRFKRKFSTRRNIDLSYMPADIIRKIASITTNREFPFISKRFSQVLEPKYFF